MPRAPVQSKLINLSLWKITIQFILVPDHHQRLRDVWDDVASQQPRPARLPRQLWGHRGWRGALRLRLEGGAQAGQPSGGDLQGGRGHSHPRANDRPAAHIRQRQGGYNPASRRRHPSKVTPLSLTFSATLQTKRGRQPHAGPLLPLNFSCCCVVVLRDKEAAASQNCNKGTTKVAFLVFPCSWDKLLWHLLQCLRWLAKKKTLSYCFGFFFCCIRVYVFPWWFSWRGGSLCIDVALSLEKAPAGLQSHADMGSFTLMIMREAFWLMAHLTPLPLSDSSHLLMFFFLTSPDTLFGN